MRCWAAGRRTVCGGESYSRDLTAIVCHMWSTPKRSEGYAATKKWPKSQRFSTRRSEGVMWELPAKASTTNCTGCGYWQFRPRRRQSRQEGDSSEDVTEYRLQLKCSQLTMPTSGNPRAACLSRSGGRARSRKVPYAVFRLRYWSVMSQCLEVATGNKPDQKSNAVLTSPCLINSRRVYRGDERNT